MEKHSDLQKIEEIIESITNGNWKQARDQCIEYRFYAKDLLKNLDEYIDYADWSNELYIATLRDFILLIELVWDTESN